MNLYYRTVALALLLVLVVCQGCASADLKTEKYQNACLGSDELVFVSDKKGSLVEAECVNGFYVPKNNSNVKVAELSFWLDEDDCGIWNIAIDGDPSEIMVLMVEKTICTATMIRHGQMRLRFAVHLLLLQRMGSSHGRRITSMPMN